MITRRQSFRLAGTVAASTALLTGCGQPSDSASPGRGITWLTSRSDNEPAILAVKKIAAEYQKDHPDFSITVESVPDRPSYLQRVKILASSGHLPDWFDSDPEPYFTQIADSGQLADIGALYEELGIEKNFYDIAIEYPKLQGGPLRLMTWNANAEYFFYNKHVFDKAGVAPPDTLDDLLPMCDAIQEAGVPAFGLAGKNRWPYYRFLAMPPFRATGNDFVTDLSRGKASMTSATGLDGATFLQQLGERGFQEGFTTADAPTALNLMVTGEAAMYYTGSWDVASFLGDDGKLLPNIGYFRMPPAGPDDATSARDYFVNPGIGTAIRKDSLDDGMKDFLAFMFERYPNTLLYDFDTLPSLKPDFRDELLPIYQDVLEDVDAAHQYAHVWDVVLDAKTVDVMSRQAETLSLGTSTPQQFGEAVDKAVAEYVDAH